MILRPSPRLLPVFLLACVVPLAFALFTQHAWEDYYITFRSSKHLATGAGLVFNVGDRLHTFTSPLGVLLPAAASLLTLNQSDAAALWLFRLMSIAALAGALTLLVATARRKGYAGLAIVALAVWVGLDAKIVDFSINGMETGFLLLFTAYLLWALLARTPRQPLHLGFAWGGLMWTRPDAFIPIAALAGGFLLFHRRPDTGTNRVELLRLFLRAGLIATLVYGPWLLFAWRYFGSPIPHTIVAKATAAGPRSLAILLPALPEVLLRACATRGPLEGLFTPAYLLFGGWPVWLVQAARWTAIGTALLWLVPGLRTETRASSFTVLVLGVYLAYYPPFIFPWYLCLPALLGFFALAGAVAELTAAAGTWRWAAVASGLRATAAAIVLAVGAAALWFTVEAARQLRAQQAIIENGTRRAIGEWLHAHAAPGDTVLLEPLGYIGYFSQLRTFDLPGLSSREVVDVIRQHGFSWGAVAAAVHPVWMVLRPGEVEAIRSTHPEVLVRYEAVREYDARTEIASLGVRGREYLGFDARFTVFHRRPASAR
jgi:hypothetical protein